MGEGGFAGPIFCMVLPPGIAGEVCEPHFPGFQLICFLPSGVLQGQVPKL